MFYVVSGDKNKKPAIVETYKSKAGATRAYNKRVKFWEIVKIIEGNYNLADISGEILR